MKAAIKHKTDDSSSNGVLNSSAKPFPIQRKLQIGAVNDPLEKEADDMADRVMRMPESTVIQRKCSDCEEKEKINRKPLSSQITPFVQRKSNGGGIASSNVSNRIQSSRGGGNPLPPPSKNFMESRFGADFSEVRVHTGSEASNLSRDLNAKAFTVGKDVYFNEGQFAPETSSGKRLLAHELTHVMQQNEVVYRKYIGEKEKIMSERSPLAGRDYGATLPYREAIEMVDCINIMGQENINYCNREVLGLETDLSAICDNITPGGTPSVNASAGGNDTLPSTASAVLDWEVIDRDSDHWGVCARSLTLNGNINLKPWPNHPSTMRVPNTPNPVDGGNINNTAGSPNHWQSAIDDLSDYDTAGGGAGPDWHSLEASRAHEWAHWDIDYVSTSVNGSAGGNWPQVNTDLNTLTELKSRSATTAEARIVLAPRVDALISTWRSNTIRAWNAITNDVPGGGGAGYAAGMTILNGLIANIRAYKDAKGW